MRRIFCDVCDLEVRLDDEDSCFYMAFALRVDPASKNIERPRDIANIEELVRSRYETPLGMGVADHVCPDCFVLIRTMLLNAFPLLKITDPKELPNASERSASVDSKSDHREEEGS